MSQPSKSSLSMFGLLLALAAFALVVPAAATPPAPEISLEQLLADPVSSSAQPFTMPAKSGEACPVEWTGCTAEFCQVCCLEWGGWTGSLCASGQSCLCWDA